MYIDTSYRPKSDVVCTFYLKPSSSVSLEQAAEAVAAESSIGTWTDISTMNKSIYNMRARVFKIEAGARKTSAIIKVAYPAKLFEPGNMPQILSSIAGNIFGMKSVSALRLLDVNFPKSITKSFPGPRYGILGVRKLLKISDRPLLGTIIKPKIGLSSRDHAKVAYEAWVGGIDIVKDDENLTNQSFNRFKTRVVATLRMRDKAEKETGERKVYMPNITAPYEEMMKRAEFVAAHGGRYVMVDVITAGFSALHSVRKHVKLVLHAHRAMHGAITRSKDFGITMLALAKMLRLVGVDQLHAGTIVGKMEGAKQEVMNVYYALRKKMNVKPVFPVASGGLHPGMVEKLISLLGTDVIIQAGGGVHGHPNGTRAGATAMRQAVDAVMKGVSLVSYAKDHKELASALEKWGPKNR